MQDKDTTNMLDVLAESLVAYGRTIRRTWYGVLAVFVIMELLRHGVRAATAHSGILCGKGLPLDNLVGIMLSLTVGLIASALVVRTTLLLFDGHEASSKPNATGGLWHGWRRLFFTVCLLCMAWVAFIVALSAGLVGCILLVRSSLAQIGGMARWSLLGLGIAIELGIVALAIWLFVRWMFAPALSLMRPVCGLSALRLSSDFVKGRFGCCISYFLLVLLVSSGIGIIPAFIAASGHSLRANVLTWPFAPLLSVAIDFVKLYPIVALSVFWLRKSGSASTACVGGTRHRLVGIALLVLGACSFVVYAFIVSRTWSQTGDLARQPREETLSRLYGSLSSKRLSHHPTATDVTGESEEQTNDEPLPTFDASTITGDGLCALLGQRTKRLSRRQCQTLQGKLTGRKLSLHNLRSHWSGTLWRNGKDAQFYLILKPMSGGRIEFRVSFAKREDEELAKRLVSEYANYVEELVGTVVEDSEGITRIETQPVFRMVAEKIVPHKPLAELPPFDPKHVTTDDLMAMSTSLTNGFTDVLVDDLVQKIGGHEFNFTNLVVTGYQELKSKRGILRATFQSGDSWNQKIHLCAEVSTTDVAALPWGFSRNCRIRRLTGKIAPRTIWGNEDRGCCYIGEITLGNATFEAGWENGELPELDANAITGDEFVSLVSKLGASHRAAQARMIAQRFSTRRLSFSECEVLNRDAASLDGQRRFRLGFGDKDSHGNYALECVSAARKDDSRLDGLGIGVRLKGVSGVFVPDDEQKDMPSVCLDDMTFASATQTEPFPAFDPEILTGNELVRLLSDRKTLPSPADVRKVQKNLSGRELTIDLTTREFLRYMSRYSEHGDGVKELHLSFAKRNRGLANWSVVCRLREDIPFSFDSIINRQMAKWRLTAVVAPLHRADPECRWLVLEDASLEDISNRAK